MTRIQMVAVAVLVLTAMVLVVLLQVLIARKAVLRAEGADLATSEIIMVEAELRELRANADRFEPGTHAFVTLDASTRGVAVLSGRWNDVPLHGGSSLHGQGEALAGASRVPEGDAMTFDGKSYEVVGRLGVHADGPFADAAVLADDAVFNTAAERLRLDGPSVVDRFRAAFPGRSVEVVDQGTNRRTNVDVVTPVLASAGGVLAALLIVTAAWLSVRAESRVASVRYRVGAAQRGLLLGGAARVGALGAVCLVIALVLERILGATLLVTPNSGPLLALGVITFVLIVTGGFMREGRRWN